MIWAVVCWRIMSMRKSGCDEALNVEVIDIYHDYYPHDTWDDLYLYTDDGLHPNEAGREKIAQTIAERLNKE